MAQGMAVDTAVTHGLIDLAKQPSNVARVDQGDARCIGLVLFKTCGLIHRSVSFHIRCV